MWSLALTKTSFDFWDSTSYNGNTLKGRKTQSTNHQPTYDMELAEDATPTDAIEQFGDKVMGNELEEVEPGRFQLTNNCFPDTDPLFLEVDGDTIRVFNEDNDEVFVVEKLGALGSLLYGWHSIRTDHF